jgi:hypothetical protein
MLMAILGTGDLFDPRLWSAHGVSSLMLVATYLKQGYRKSESFTEVGWKA